nr:aldo/keto reductase [uncultured Candidatus Pelagibacter sp.]
MNYKKLGNTDLNVSTICLGTMTWGEQNTQEEGFEQMDYALDQGVNFWDTAELYAVPPREETYGHTEIIIGNWFQKIKKERQGYFGIKSCWSHESLFERWWK